MEVFFIWLLFAIGVGAIASKRGRSGFGWFIVSAILSPLIGVILVLIMKDLSPRAVAANNEVPTAESHVRCPDCRELVRADARKCKHCGTALAPAS